jgi:hypothetical protein
MLNGVKVGIFFVIPANFGNCAAMTMMIILVGLFCLFYKAMQPITIDRVYFFYNSD